MFMGQKVMIMINCNEQLCHRLKLGGERVD
jgi:hypothetical protein